MAQFGTVMTGRSMKTARVRNSERVEDVLRKEAADGIAQVIRETMQVKLIPQTGAKRRRISGIQIQA